MKLTATSLLITIAIFIAGMGIGWLAHPIYSSADILAGRATCTKDGAAFVAQQYTNIPPEFNVKQNYAFIPDMSTCLVDVERQTNQGVTYSIYDIYANKEIAGYAEYTPEYREALGLATSSGLQRDSQNEYLMAEKKYFSQ